MVYLLGSGSTYFILKILNMHEIFSFGMRKRSEMSLHEYKLKRLSLVTMEIIELCCDICLFVQKLNKYWYLFIGVLFHCMNNM